MKNFKLNRSGFLGCIGAGLIVCLTVAGDAAAVPTSCPGGTSSEYFIGGAPKDLQEEECNPQRCDSESGPVDDAKVVRKKGLTNQVTKCLDTSGATIADCIISVTYYGCVYDSKRCEYGKDGNKACATYQTLKNPAYETTTDSCQYASWISASQSPQAMRSAEQKLGLAAGTITTTAQATAMLEVAADTAYKQSIVSESARKGYDTSIALALSERSDLPTSKIQSVLAALGTPAPTPTGTPPACGSPTPSPTPSRTPTPTPSKTPPPSPTPSRSPAPSPTQTR